LIIEFERPRQRRRVLPAAKRRVAPKQVKTTEEPTSSDQTPAPIGHNGGPSLSKDILVGGHAIAEFIFGDQKYHKRLYHLSSSKIPIERRIPTFRLGDVLCARKSTILKWIAEQEKRGIRDAEERS